MTGELTDFSSHPIEGYARMAKDDGYFKVPLITHVKGNLWQGGCREGVKLPDDFKYVVSLYQWERFWTGPETQVFFYKMYDADDEPNKQEIDQIADLINACVDSGKTLVHCQAGLNRSGLVTAYALMKRGHTADDAITMLRNSRCKTVLCNETFEKWLLKQ